MASPENNAKWAEAAAAGDLSFPSVEQDTGYAVGEDLPNSQYNQYMRDLSRWVTSGFADLADFVQIADAGQVGVVNSYDPSVAPGDVEQAIATTVDPAACYGVDVDGRYVYSYEGDVAAPILEVVRRSRDDLTTIDAAGSFAVTALAVPVATELAIAANGTHVAVTVENTVRLHLAADGSQVWTYPHGGVIYDVAIDHEAVYIVGAAGTGAIEARKILFTAGAGALVVGDSDWDFAHGASLLACDTDGVRLYVGGLPSGGHSMSAINAASGLVAPGDPVSWDSGSADQVEARSIRTDGARVYNIENNAGTRTIRVHGAADGIERASRAVGATAPIGHAGLDQNYYYTVIAGFMRAYTKDELHWALFRDRRGVGAAELYGVVSDGDKVFVAGEQSDPLGPSNDNLERVNRAARGVQFTRINPATARALPMRQLAVPEES